MKDSISIRSILKPRLEKVYETAVQDSDGVMANRDGYRMRYEEVPELMAKEIEAVLLQLLESKAITVTRDTGIIGKIEYTIKAIPLSSLSELRSK